MVGHNKQTTAIKSFLNKLPQDILELLVEGSQLMKQLEEETAEEDRKDVQAELNLIEQELLLEISHHYSDN